MFRPYTKGNPAVKGTLWTRIGLGLVHYYPFWELNNFLSNAHYRVVSLVRTLAHRQGSTRRSREAAIMYV